MVEQTECEWFKSRAESHQQIKPEFVIIGLSVDGALPRQPILGFIFHKTKGIPALLLLFLRGFAQRPDTTTHGLKGFKKSPAATLLDAISPHLASEPNWLMKMLLPEAHQKPVGAELFRSLTGRLEEEIFRAHWDRDRSTFTVNLRPVWQPSKTAPHPFKLYLVGYSRFIVANRQPSEGRSERFNGRLESRFHGVSCSNKAGCTRLPPIFDRSGARAVGSKSRPAARFTLLLTH